MGLLSRRAPAATFEEVGDEYGGTVTRDMEEVQQREFNLDGSVGELQFWDKEKTEPMMMLIVTVDDRRGERSIYVRGHLLHVTKKAVWAEGSQMIRKGDYYSAKFVAEEEPAPRAGRKVAKNAPKKKIYEAVYKPGKPQSRASRSVLGPDDDRWAGTQDDEPPF